jgi:hypothetical protein
MTQWPAGLALLVLLWVTAAVPAAAVQQVQFANGVRATIHSAEDIMGQAKALGAGRYEIQTSAGPVLLDGDPAALVPFEFAHVEAALASMHDLGAGIDVNVYLLPARPAAGEGSFARRDVICLAPGTGPVGESTAAYITTHELGHVLTWAYVDRRDDRWASYLRLRGLEAEANGPTAVHAERAREILAEDIRFLFGGLPANRSNSIENHELSLPHQVADLKELLAGYFATPDLAPATTASAAFPNPCNPRTTIAMSVPVGTATDPAAVVLRVFDLRGALVRTVVGGTLANSQVTIPWNGAADSGQTVASGRYFYLLQSGGLMARGTVTLVR